jgi:hypothetical protein
MKDVHSFVSCWDVCAFLLNDSGFSNNLCFVEVFFSFIPPRYKDTRIIHQPEVCS